MLKDKNEDVDLNSNKKGSQLQLNKLNSTSNANLHGMSYSQEGSNSSEKRDSKALINETTPSNIQVPKLTIGLFSSQELNGVENMNESGDKLNQIENVIRYKVLKPCFMRILNNN